MKRVSGQRTNNKTRPKAIWTQMPGAQVSQPKARKRIKTISTVGGLRLLEYTEVRNEFLKEHPNCQRCRKKKSTETHHSRGRVGKLLTNKRYFKALCQKCHEWVHQNIELARQEGLICAKGLWGQQ